MATFLSLSLQCNILLCHMTPRINSAYFMEISRTFSFSSYLPKVFRKKKEKRKKEEDPIVRNVRGAGKSISLANPAQQNGYK